MNWIKTTPFLSGPTVELRPLEKAHFPSLEALAKDMRIWEFMSFPVYESHRFHELFNLALEERAKGNQYPFVVYHKQTRKIIGSTRLLEMQQNHRKLEIGWTWLDPAYWATVVNPECKLLLLSYCFEELNTSRVMLRTDENNKRSRRAIEKIGGVFEGIVRHDIIRDNDTRRNSAYFSIIDTEWADTKTMLSNLLNNKYGVTI
jgi:RimJ/RimL family protein N-acetyltransferase